MRRTAVWLDEPRARPKGIIAIASDFALTGHAHGDDRSSSRDSEIEVLLASGEPGAAIDFVRRQAEAAPRGDHDALCFAGMEELADAAPRLVAERLLPWFAALAGSEIRPGVSERNEYPASAALPWDWNLPDLRGSVFAGLRGALQNIARDEPAEAAALIAPHYTVEVDEVHELIAQTLAAGGAALAEEGLQYLLGDPRRFLIGEPLLVEGGKARTCPGGVTHQLVRATGPALDGDQLAALRRAIESWRPYRAAQAAEWGDRLRDALLRELPARSG